MMRKIAMGKQDLVRSVWLRADKEFTQEECRELVDIVFDAIFDELEGHGAVIIPNFGTFYVEERTGRTYYDNFNGTSKEVPTRPYPRFRASERLKECVNRPISFRNRDL